jgi:transcriptional regulator NrdR family protein
MIRCPSCESTESALVERVHFGDGQAADRRECAVCGEQWMVPVDPQVEGDIESIELRDDSTGEAPDEADGVEEWFR